MSGAPRASLADALLAPRLQRWTLVALAALILLARIGRGTLANYDDCYYAEKAHEMLASGDWLTPRFSGVVRLDNPPLYLWLVAALFRCFGQSDWAAILPSALAGVACVGLLHVLATRLGADAFRAWCGSAVLLTTGYFVKYAGHAMFDVFLAMLFVLAMLAYRRAWEGSLRAWALLGLLTGLGVLTKSVLGLFPLLVAFAHLAWCGRWRALLGPGAWLAVAVAALTVAPWYGAQLRIHPEQFLSEHVRWLLWQRGFQPGHAAAASAPPFGYVRELAQTYWPWLPFALAGAWICARQAFAPRGAGSDAAAWDTRAGARLLLLWPAVVIGVMSFGREKKLWYVMDAFPGLALLAAVALAAWVRSEGARRRTLLTGTALFAVAGAVLALTPWFAPPARRPDLQVVAHAARALVPPDSAILTPSGNYFGVAHQFVYYSRHRLDMPLHDRARVRAALDAGQWGLFDAAQRDTFIGADSLAYPAVVTSGAWSLVHAAPRPEVRLEPTVAFE
jgi:4-amino-4-deoxy-L-arabinose transferase-like glycosyltransferase